MAAYASSNLARGEVPRCVLYVRMRGVVGGKVQWCVGDGEGPCVRGRDEAVPRQRLVVAQEDARLEQRLIKRVHPGPHARVRPLGEPPARVHVHKGPDEVEGGAFRPHRFDGPFGVKFVRGLAGEARQQALHTRARRT